MKSLMMMAVTMVFAMAMVARAAVKSGEPAPDFAAASTKGDVKLADYKGKWLVLYFYPKSFTPGCTRESCSLRDGYEQIQKIGAEILGVSCDDLEKQKKFKAKFNLPFELVADADKKLTKAYDVMMVGGLASSRYTFLINPDGKIEHVFDNVDCAGHNNQVLTELQKLQAAQKK